MTARNPDRAASLQLAYETAPDLPRHEAERLLMAAGGWSRLELAFGVEPDPADLERFAALVRRRREGEPLQYIEGSVQFGPLDLLIDPRALIPRPETEQLWEVVIARMTEPPSIVVDLGTGSGALALACKHQWPEATVYAVDLSLEAVALARENVARTGLGVTVLDGDLFDPLPPEVEGLVDLIVSNPPYVGRSELAALPVEVRDHEPTMALVAGPSGDEVLARIASGAMQWLRSRGVVACEISEFRAAHVRRLFAPYRGQVVADLAGKPRFVVGARP